MKNSVLNCDQSIQTWEQRNSSPNKSLRFHQPVKLYKNAKLVKFDNLLKRQKDDCLLPFLTNV